MINRRGTEWQDVFNIWKVIFSEDSAFVVTDYRYWCIKHLCPYGGCECRDEAYVLEVDLRFSEDIDKLLNAHIHWNDRGGV